MRDALDTFICLVADLWLRLRYRRLWRCLARDQRTFGVTRVGVAVPRLANEKFLWRKVFDRDPRFVIASDKIASKEWVKAQGIDVRVPATLWSGTELHQMPQDLWERPIYIKAAHGWNMNIPVLTPPDKVTKSEIIAQAHKFLDRAHGAEAGQWAYSKVPHRLIVEEAISPGTELMEVKYYTYGPIVEQFVLRRAGPPVTAARWLRQPDGSFVRSDKPTAISPIVDETPLPDVALGGLALAADIGAHFDHIRVDTLMDGDDIYLGELTVYSLSGRVYVNGEKVDDAMNRSWDLRRSWFLSTPQAGWRGIYAAALRRKLNRTEVAGKTACLTPALPAG